jgi:hypothetical protein
MISFFLDITSIVLVFITNEVSGSGGCLRPEVNKPILLRLTDRASPCLPASALLLVTGDGGSRRAATFT